MSLTLRLTYPLGELIAVESFYGVVSALLFKSAVAVSQPHKGIRFVLHLVVIAYREVLRLTVDCMGESNR